jgi:acyl carrier protein
MKMSEDTKRIMRAFIVENFLFGDEASLPADGDSLIAGGIIDSTGVLELVAFIEEQFEFTIADSDIVPGNLDTIDAVAAFVERQTPAAVTAAA